jgi:glycosyltransferase involved in cell wall biosynthesis
LEDYMSTVFVTTSWDDGHKLNIKLADLLKRYGIKATFYISPQDRQFAPTERLAAEEIRQLAQHFEIGAHTLTHPHLDRLDAAAARNEIIGSKRTLEAITGKPVRTFAYPYGDYNKETKRLVREAGFRRARTVERFMTRSVDELAIGTSVDIYDHRRDGMTSVMSLCGRHPWRVLRMRRWDNLGKAMFALARQRNEVFHLWGHSQEIEAHDDWQRLEAFLEWLREQPDVIFCCNSDTPSPSPRLLITVPYCKPHSGGVEQYSYHISKGLQETKNWHVAVVASGDRKELSIDSYEGVRTYRLPYRLKISNTPFGLTWYRTLKRIISTERPDIIISHAPVPGMLDVTAHRAKRVPLVVTYHMGSMLKSSNLPDMAIRCYERVHLPRILRQARWIVCSSDFVQRSPMIEAYSYKSTIISPGVDTCFFKPAQVFEEAGHSLLHIGGLGTGERHKGLDISLGVVAELKQTYPDVRLTVVGSGDRQAQFAALAEQLGITPNVEFRGRLDGHELVSAYQDADVLIAPSRNESFGMAVAEAMACGLPVVASAVEGIPDLVDDGISGYLVAPGNISGFAEKISELFGDAALSKRISENARRRAIAKVNSWPRQVEVTAQLLRRII